ncbi:MAG: polysaccharide deacetylase family protein [Oscillochloris sp.]|nr:polysaccharide deacetylase family protein [Oscillochloris sp.]
MTSFARDLANPFSRAIAAAGRRFLGTITHVRTAEPVAALTFDDGPHPLFTPRLLDVLAQHQARATFFVIGTQAAAHPDLIRRIVAAGHVIANHTHQHIRLPETDRLTRLRDIGQCRRVLGPNGARLLRPPYGGQSVGSRIDALLLGYEVVTWNMHAEDWAGHDTDYMAERLVRQLRPGSIILLHDALLTPRVVAAADREPTIQAVDRFLQHTSPQYRFVTVPELMRLGTPVRTRWFKPAQ